MERESVLLEVAKNGDALQHAPQHLRSDREVVLAAHAKPSPTSHVGTPQPPVQWDALGDSGPFDPCSVGIALAHASA
eukprot:5639429-Amphidinium_carterae.1